MTIMLEIIAANLISFARSLNTEAILNQQILDCTKQNNDLNHDLIHRKYRLKGTTEVGEFNYSTKFCKQARSVQ